MLIIPGVSFADLTWELWQLAPDVDLGGRFSFSRHVFSGTVERRHGSIVAVGGLFGGLFGGFNAMTGGGAGPNSAAKMGLLGVARSLAIDLAPHNVRVNMAVPGRIAAEGRTNTLEDSPTAIHLSLRSRMMDLKRSR